MQKYTPSIILASIILFAFAIMEILFSIGMINEKINYMLERQDKTDDLINDLKTKYSSIENILKIATKSADINNL